MERLTNNLSWSKPALHDVVRLCKEVSEELKHYLLR